jgi:hypothetical protein
MLNFGKKIHASREYVFTSMDHCNVHQLFIVTSLQLLLPVIQTNFFRCQDFQSAEEEKSVKIKKFV